MRIIASTFSQDPWTPVTVKFGFHLEQLRPVRKINTGPVLPSLYRDPTKSNVENNAVSVLSCTSIKKERKNNPEQYTNGRYACMLDEFVNTFITTKD